MDKTTQKLNEIPVTGEVKLVYDLSDGWFTVFDPFELDTLGAVTLSLNDLPALIAKLQELQALLLSEEEVS